MRRRNWGGDAKDNCALTCGNCPKPGKADLTEFADLGRGKCLTANGKDPKHKWVGNVATWDAAKELCSARNDCSGFSWSSHGSALLWLQPGLKGGGSGWGGCSCHVKKGSETTTTTTTTTGTTTITTTTTTTTTTEAAVHNYTYVPKGCVNGCNMQKYPDKSVDECAAICDADLNCKAFEYGAAYGGAGDYKPRDCQPQSCANSAGCDGTIHNLDLYIKKAVKKEV